MIYVTRVITEATTVFVSASACNPSFGKGYAHQPYRRKSHDKKRNTIIRNIRNCAKACSKDAAELKKECKALYEEVKDFIDYESLDLDDYLYGVKITLKDEVELTFDTDTQAAYNDRDTKVRIIETNLLGLHHYSYRDEECAE